MMQIDRCYCFDVPFGALKKIAEETGAGSISELQRHREFGFQCQLCHPYVRRMLRTGEIVFGQILVEADEPE